MAFAQVSFDYDDFAVTDGLLLIEDASQVGNEIHVTPAANGQRGAFYRDDQEDISGGFETIFQFRFNSNGADGLAFIIQNEAFDAINTTTGSTMGYISSVVCAGYAANLPGISQSLALEFDTWQSGPCFGEPGGGNAGRHIAVCTNGIDPNTGRFDKSLAGQANPINFEDNVAHTVRVVYDATVHVLRVYMDDLTVPLFDAKVDLEYLIQSPTAWVGFTAATGGANAVQAVLNWEWTATVPFTYDDCAAAITMQVGNTFGFDTTAATNDGPSSACHDSPPADVWFQFTPDDPGDYTVSLCGSSFDTVLAVYDGSTGCPGTPLDCDNDTCGTASQLTFFGAPGVTYYFQVGGLNTADTGVGEIALTLFGGVAPANDECSAAEVFAFGQPPVAFSTVFATSDGIDPGCGATAGTPDIWYQYVANGSSEITVTTAGSDYDTVLAVWDGSGGCPMPGDLSLACNDDEILLLTSSLSFTGVGGETYYIQVTGFNGRRGDGTLDIFEVAPTGACCLPDGTCMIATQAECDATGGDYQGDGTDCGAFEVEDCVNAFEDISATGTIAAIASSSDDNGQIVPIGFTFSFFGDDHNDIAICSNGYLTFGPDLSDFTNDPIPTATDPNDAIFPYWDDWSPNQGGDVKYETIGTSPNQRFIAQWTDVPHFDGTGTSTFQAVLFEGSNAIEFRYSDLSPNSPTVGVENQDGSAGTDADPMGTVGPGVCRSLTPGNPCVGGGAEFIRGDFNNDGGVNFLVDALFGLNAGFVPGSPQPQCFVAADANGDRSVNFLVDALFMLNAGFVPASPLPPLPYPDCGEDQNGIDVLGCDNPNVVCNP